MLMNSTSTPRSRLASRKPNRVTDLKLDINQMLLPQYVENSERFWIGVPTWRPLLPEIDANLRSIKDFFMPSGGKNVNLRDGNGRTALHEAIHLGNEAVVEYLLSHGADIYAPDDHGFTPLDVANRFANRNLAAAVLRKRQTQLQQEILTRPFEEERVEEEDNSKDGFKWAIALLNAGIELYQAVTSQEAGYWGIKAGFYRRLGVALALMCVMLSVSEIVLEGKRSRVEWKKRRGCYWFYYPGRNGRAFGSFLPWFGLVSSMVQLWLSVATLVVKRVVLKFDYMGLLLSVCYLLARFGCRERTMGGVVKCREHGECEIAGRFAKGRWVFECCHCRV